MPFARTCLFASLCLLLLSFLFPEVMHAQSITLQSFGTSYNNVSAQYTADAGWNSDTDPNCSEAAAPSPNAIAYITWQVDNGPSGNVTQITQTGQAQECYGGDNTYQFSFSFADTAPASRTVTVTATFCSIDGNDCYQATDQESYTVPGATGQPKYYIVATLYVPPGNASANGFTTTQSNGTTDTVSNTFQTDTSTTFSGGILGSGTEFTFGSSVQNGSSQMFQETHSAGYGHTLDATLNEINHSKDLIYLWLNPQVTFVQTGANTANYSFSTVNNEQPDILACTLADFQNPSQMSPNCQCAPYTLGNATVPGVCSICANPSSCTAADFTDIVNADELATTSVGLTPNQGWCSSDNRYCYVTSDDLPVGNPNSFIVNDSQLTAQTFSQQKCHSVSYSSAGGLNVFDLFSLQQKDTTKFTWCDSESVGGTNGVSNQAQVSLASKTTGCTFGVDIYEDTEYHTFVLAPSGGTYPSYCNGQ